VRSFRGPGAAAGLEILESVRSELGLPVLSDIHLPGEAARAAEVLDILQIPAFLCRQTSLLEAAGRTGKPVNLKKGQFLAPGDLARAVEKVRGAGSDQVLVTERMAPWLPLPASGLRQTAEGTVMIGATKEEVGLDTGTSAAKAAFLARKTLQIVPKLATLRLVRQWSGLRVMTPDSYPIYAQSQSHPGAFVLLCHSGVTLAAAHADRLAEAIDDGELPLNLDPFHHRRFSADVRQAI